MAESYKDQIVSDNAQCIGIAYVTRRVDPVEHAATHRYATEIIGYDDDDFDALSALYEDLASEFALSPEQVVRAIEIAEIKVRGASSNG